MLSPITIVLSVMVAVAIAADVLHLGCFQDRKIREFNISKCLGANATGEACQSFCKAQNQSFYALQASDWCFCGKTYKYNQVSMRLCNLPCKGNRKTTCGGFWRNQISTTGIDSFPNRRLGCFHDRQSRDMPNITHLGRNNSRKACVNHCKAKNFKFCGLQAGTWCSCGNSYGKYGNSTADKCATICPDELSATCGGHWTNEVYATGL